MCNCRSNLEAKLTARFVEQYPDGVDHDVRLQGYSFVFPNSINDNPITKPGLEYHAKAKFLVKKSQLMKEKTIKGTMLANFCPFCGMAYSAAKEGAG